MNARTAGMIQVAINVTLGLAFVHSGAAAWLWARIERDVPWRTGPTWDGVLVYFAIYWGAWVTVEAGTRWCDAPRRGIPRLRFETLARFRAAPRRSAARLCVRSAAAGSAAAAAAARALVASCVLVAIQVLMPSIWLPVALATLLLAMLIDACIVRESLRRTVIAWAWSGAGVALATLLVHPYFIGLPLFVVRLAVVMTVWDAVGERLGVSQRLARLVPSLYFSSADSGPALTAAQAPVPSSSRRG